MEGRMEGWFEAAGRPALFEALSDVCDQLGNNFRSGFRTYSANQERLITELETLRQKTTLIDRLEEENRSLKAEIRSLKTTNRRESRTPLAPRTPNQVFQSKWSPASHFADDDNAEPAAPQKECSKLQAKYSKLHKNHLELQEALVESRRLLRERTQAYERWVDHAKALAEQSQKRAQKVKKLEARLAQVTQAPPDSSFSSDSGNPQPPPRPVAPLSFQSATAALQVSGASKADCNTSVAHLTSPTRNTEDSPPGEVTTEKCVPRIDNQTEQLPRSDFNTDGGHDEIPLPPLQQHSVDKTQSTVVKSEPSSDTPVVVSERCLRKRKPENNGEDSERAPSRIKTEDSQISLEINEHRQFAPHESIDFDADARRIRTPKKLQRTYHIEDDESQDSDGVVQVERLMKTPPTGCPEKRVEDPTGANMPQPVPRLHGSSVDRVSEMKAPNRPPDAETDRSSALRPLDTSRMPESSSGGYLRPDLRRPTRTPRGLVSLAEDDELPEESVPRTKQKPRTSAQLLHDLLELPAQGDIAPQVPAQAQDTTSSSHRFNSTVPPRRVLPFGKNASDNAAEVGSMPNGPAPGRRSRSTSTPRQQRRSRSGVSDKAVTTQYPRPLRELPLSQLRLEDFKINAARNEGYDYAFSDVYRGKDERACLTGCVRESCCGPKWRNLALAQRRSVGASAFQALLESYMGDECFKLAIISEQEKEDLWVKAKMQELANSHGRHRERYHRKSTPPGFWRTDFPSTQEGAEDRDEATAMERQSIEERYREAMRPGGRWLFRDGS
ncbi:DNA repair protein endonuclease SAE2/CtIP C-terminus-domain-containing protein [Xylariomycetidae sp. FL0641]|nr:DNA repair protein endonuclease SAE2/CtIP C-terminus-domain-containing protein [Xylariomycetidae sp. FL0641]